MAKIHLSKKQIDNRETNFSDVKNEFIEHEISYLKNRFRMCFPDNDNPEQLMNEQPLSHLLYFLKKQTNLQQAGEIINTILIARVKSLIVKNPNK